MASRRRRTRAPGGDLFHAGETQRDLPATARRHPRGSQRQWPRFWAYALHGLAAEELERELAHCPEHLRAQVRYLVRYYLPTIEAFADGRAKAQANRELADLQNHHTRGYR